MTDLSFYAVIQYEKIPKVLLAQNWTRIYHGCDDGLGGVSLHVNTAAWEQFMAIHEQGSKSLAYDPQERPEGEAYRVEIAYWSQQLQVYGSEFVHRGMWNWSKLLEQLERGGK